MKEAEAMFAVAHAQPATAKEIAEFWDGGANNAASILTRLWRQGLIVRRERDPRDREQIQLAYEYAIASPETPHDKPRKLRANGDIYE